MKTKRSSLPKKGRVSLFADNHVKGQPSREDIARYAYLIWEQEGRPAGRDVVHWLQAETHLRQGRLQVAVQI